METTVVNGNIADMKVDVTKKGDGYRRYKIGDDWFSQFQNIDEELKVGDAVSGKYSVSGDFKNLVYLNKFPNGDAAKVAQELLNATDSDAFKGAEARPPNPAFFGMIFNKAVDLAISECKDGELMMENVENNFYSLWTVAVKLKKEKGVV